MRTIKEKLYLVYQSVDLSSAELFKAYQILRIWFASWR